MARSTRPRSSTSFPPSPALMDAGHRCLFVSSGAVGSGVSALGLTEYPKDTATRQACAAVGQARLMQTYSSLFSNFDITIAQVLLTAADLGTPERAGYVSDTFRRLLMRAAHPADHQRKRLGRRRGVEIRRQRHALRPRRETRRAGAPRHPAHQRGRPARSGNQHAHPRSPRHRRVFRHVRDDKGRFSMGGMASKLRRSVPPSSRHRNPHRPRPPPGAPRGHRRRQGDFHPFPRQGGKIILTAGVAGPRRVH